MSWRLLALCATLVVAPGWHGARAQAPAPEQTYRGRAFGDWRQDLARGAPMVRERAVVAPYEFGEPAVPHLVGAIADQDFNVRTLAIFCLGRLGGKAREAVPALARTLEDRDWIVRSYAAGALGLLEANAVDAAPAPTRTAVEEANSQVRQAATFALGRLGPAARESTRLVLQQLSSAGTDEAARARAAELLRDLDRRWPPASGR